MTAAEQVGSSLAFVYIDNDTNTLAINSEDKWATVLPKRFDSQRAEQAVYELCQKHNIDYVSPENVTNTVREAINDYYARNRPPKEKSLGQPSQSKTQEALELAMDKCVELFVDQHGNPYAAVKVKDHVETLALNRTRFRNWLCRAYYESKQGILNGEDVNNVLSILKAEAEFGDNRKELQLRASLDSPHTIYYDLTNSHWQAVKIAPEGWAIESAPIMFTRYSHQQPQITPASQAPPDIFDKFFALTNVRSEDDILLLKCYIVALFVPGISKPVLMLHGEQGSAKSTLQELIRMLVDPSSVRTLSFPRDVNELVQKLSHHYIAYFDNVSYIKEWVSDELCKAVTGLGFSKRMLHTNDDDVIYNFMRCIGFNGINLGATKADLLDRGLIIHLSRIPKERRRKVKEIWQKFDEIKPQLLGYIFNTLAKVLQVQRQGGVELKEHPRMADFAEVSEIICRSMGNLPGVLLEAYYRNIGLQTEEAIEANPVALCIAKFMSSKAEWKGSVTQLLEELEQTAGDLKINTARVGGWPKAPNALSRKLNEVITNFREIGIEIDRITDTSTNTRLVQIRKSSPKSPEPPNQERTSAGGNTGDTNSIKKESSSISPEQNQARSGDTGDTGDRLSTINNDGAAARRCNNGSSSQFNTSSDEYSHNGKNLAQLETDGNVGMDNNMGNTASPSNISSEHEATEEATKLGYSIPAHQPQNASNFPNITTSADVTAIDSPHPPSKVSSSMTEASLPPIGGGDYAVVGSDNNNLDSVLGQNFATFDLEWSVDDAGNNSVIYAAGIVDNHGNEKVLHIADFGNSEAELLQAIVNEITKYLVTVGWSTTAIAVAPSDPASSTIVEGNGGAA
jgi:hypothetical protein